MKNLKCAICGRDIKQKKAKRKFCLLCLTRKSQTRIKRIRDKRLSRV